MANISVRIDDQNKFTDAVGYAIFKKKLLGKNKLEAFFINELDTLKIAYSNYNSGFKFNSEMLKLEHSSRVSIMTDRAIYRPGQQLYGKGIATQIKDGVESVMSGSKIKFEILDPNDNVLQDFELTTNEFGSFTFAYDIPKNVMTGEFTISVDEFSNIDDSSEAFIGNMEQDTRDFKFSVEEYKRPTFEISFDKITDDLLLNQEIVVKGKATAFSGGKIGDAKVSYTIRQSKKTLDYEYSTNHEFLIINGETETDSDGGFSIKFRASPENSVDLSELPAYEFNIDATITDINGASQRQKTSVNVGNHALRLDTEIPRYIDIAKENSMKISSSNLNNVFVPAQGKIDFYLKTEQKNNIKERFFPIPEIQTISDDEFKALFPYERYETYAELMSNKKELVHSIKVDTGKENLINLDFLTKQKLGSYLVVFSSIDKFGNKVTDEKTFYLSDSQNKDAKLIVGKQLNKNPRKDGFVLVQLLSKIPNLFVETEAYFHSKTIFQKEFVMKSGEQILKIPISKSIDNSVLIKISSFFENNSFDERLTVKIEQPKENFEIETISLRNKIETGQEESWSFKINSNSKDQAEILASMYDSSLDQFQLPYWQQIKKPDNYHNYSYPKNYFAKANLTNTSINNLNTIKSYIKLQDESIKLNTFGFSFTDNYSIKRKYEDDLRAKRINLKTSAGSKIISGYVTDQTGPLPGASIHVIGTLRGTQSDIDGYYLIQAAKNETLAFSYTGYKTETRNADKLKIDVKLVESDFNIDELVVTAYGVKRETAELTYAIKVYDANENQITALAGKVPGVSLENANTTIVLRGNRSIDKTSPLIVVDGQIIADIIRLDISKIVTVSTLDTFKAKTIYGDAGTNGALIIVTKASMKDLKKIIPRKNFNETAFFYPQIHTDKNGNFSFNFKSPEALTQWKLRLFAHNKKASSAYLEQMIVTQKELMVTPNLPRFLREKDSITITTKISNLTSETKSGLVMLQLFDAVSMDPIDVKMLNINNTKSFQIGTKGNTSISWKIYIPEGLQGVQYKIVAKAGNFSDGEENILPVLTNNMLITESIPVWVRENSSKEYTFENFKNNASTTLRNHQLTLEYTSNPTWLAIQALPYLMEYEHECAEQTFARYYANALASEILNSNPKIAEIFESWKKLEKPLSKLEQNEELKSVLLAETPWITDALSEEEKKKNLATLFDLQKMKDSQKAILEKLSKKQKASGGFSWFDDGNESEYITRHIISGLGHLQQLFKNATGDFDEITKKGIGYLDQKFLENSKKTEINNNSQKLILTNAYNNLHYLYARSFYLEKYPLSTTTLEITKKSTAVIKENWSKYSLYEKGLASLVLSRFGEKESAKKILESLRQSSSNNEDWGMYWIENKSGWYWYQAPIETQALLIEAFAEIENDKKSVDAMKVWLLKNKQNKNWPTTKATTEAVYALLMQGNDWISVKDKTVIKIGNEKTVTNKLAENEKEAGTGYIKMTWKTDEIKTEMATVSIQNKLEVPGFGGFYWQYFEDLDKIKSSQESPMMIEKELYLKATTSEGNQLQRITQEKPLKIGDLVTVRLVISTKENMEFVHLKDMRASCFEPIDVLSKYKWQDGLGYYQSTKDVATHFFFDKINKGKFVLEYDIRVNNLGDFSNGISTIQSMYAPEFSSHTKGIRVTVNK